MVASDASQKVAIVTGASSGIGLYTALGLARAGMRVIMAGRDRDRTRPGARFVTARLGRRKIETRTCRLRPASCGPSSRRRNPVPAPPDRRTGQQCRPVFAELSAVRGRLRADFRGQSSRSLPADQSAARPPQGFGAGAHCHRVFGAHRGERIDVGDLPARRIGR